MARINVEQKALTDPRFELLGKFLQSNRHDALGRMVLVWNECQERNSYSLPERLVGAIMGDREGAEWVAQADLAEWVNDDTLRIKGTEGRIEWLNAKREAARMNGKKGGRPKTYHEPKNNQHRLQPETTPAPAPALVGVEAIQPTPTEEKDPLIAEWEGRYTGPTLKPGELAGIVEELRGAGKSDANIREAFIHRPKRTLPRKVAEAITAPVSHNHVADIERQMLERRKEFERQS